MFNCGVERNHLIGREQWRLAAELGDINAMELIGCSLIHTVGDRIDLEGGIFWMKMAAEMGSEKAREFLDEQENELEDELNELRRIIE
jgi:TPR repeat protein